MRCQRRWPPGVICCKPTCSSTATASGSFIPSGGSSVTSPGVARAVLAEMRSLARRLAPLGAGLALGPGSRGTREERQKLNAACQWLWVVDSCVAAAQRREPVRGSDLELLRAIPPSVPLPRRLPAPAESVAGLCQGVINSAERVRHLAWKSGRRPASSPDLTVNSLRRIAATSTLTSHHCEILLRSLAARAPGHARAAMPPGCCRQPRPPGAPGKDGCTSLTRSTGSPPTPGCYLSPDADESG